MHRFSVLFLAAAWLPAFAQTNLATLSGSIVDPQKEALTGAHIELKSKSTDATRSALSNSEGLFELASVPPGEYKLQVLAQGFAPLARDVRLEVGQQMHLDLTLALGERSEIVAVVDQAEILKTNTASVGEVVET